MNIGVLTTRLFEQPRSGGELCTARLLAEMAQAGHRLHVVGRGAVPGGHGGAFHFDSVGPAVGAFQHLPAAAQIGSVLAALLGGQACTVQRLAAGGAAAQVRQRLRALAALPLDALVIDHLQAAAWADPLPAGLPAPLLVMHNLEADGYAELAAGPGRSASAALRQAVWRREARWLHSLERRSVRQAAAVACLSESDAARLRQQAAAWGAQAAIEVLPGFPGDLAGPAAASAAPRSAGTGRRIGMIGTWTWGPNRAGLCWMLAQVLPRLPCGCTLVLAGSGLDTAALPPGVVSLGVVADARRFYEQVDVVALPSVQGSGVQEKAIEALASGRAVVATPHALRGLRDVGGCPVALPGHVAVADDAAHFARLCAEFSAADAAAPAPSLSHWTGQRQARYRQVLQRCLQASAASRLAVPGARPQAAPPA